MVAYTTRPEQYNIVKDFYFSHYSEVLIRIQKYSDCIPKQSTIIFQIGIFSTRFAYLRHIFFTLENNIQWQFIVFVCVYVYCIRNSLESIGFTSIKCILFVPVNKLFVCVGYDYVVFYAILNILYYTYTNICHRPPRARKNWFQKRNTTFLSSLLHNIL